jgi:ATP-dependent Clp protease ATP-binding subunit ClpA
MKFSTYIEKILRLLFQRMEIFHHFFKRIRLYRFVFPSIKSYCVDRTAQARKGDLENIIGRDKELRMLVEILCRRSKPNVIIIGEPGVGKTALVEGFAIEITKGNVPEMLKNGTL